MLFHILTIIISWWSTMSQDKDNVTSKIPRKYFPLLKKTKINGVPVNKDEIRVRHCLRCHNEFLSMASGMRICNPCKQLESFRSNTYDAGMYAIIL